MKLILILLLLINSTFAQDSVTLKKGQVTPFDGHLVKKERLEKLVKAEKKLLVLSDLRIHQDSLIKYHKDDALLQRRKLSEAKFDSYINGLGMLVLGVLVTAFTFKVNQKVGDL